MQKKNMGKIKKAENDIRKIIIKQMGDIQEAFYLNENGSLEKLKLKACVVNLETLTDVSRSAKLIESPYKKNKKIESPNKKNKKRTLEIENEAAPKFKKKKESVHKQNDAKIKKEIIKKKIVHKKHIAKKNEKIVHKKEIVKNQKKDKIVNKKERTKKSEKCNNINKIGNKKERSKKSEKCNINKIKFKSPLKIKIINGLSRISPCLKDIAGGKSSSGDKNCEKKSSPDENDNKSSSDENDKMISYYDASAETKSSSISQNLSISEVANDTVQTKKKRGRKPLIKTEKNITHGEDTNKSKEPTKLDKSIEETINLEKNKNQLLNYSDNLSGEVKKNEKSLSINKYSQNTPKAKEKLKVSVQISRLKPNFMENQIISVSNYNYKQKLSENKHTNYLESTEENDNYSETAKINSDSKKTLKKFEGKNSNRKAGLNENNVLSEESIYNNTNNLKFSIQNNSNNVQKNIKSNNYIEELLENASNEKEESVCKISKKKGQNARKNSKYAAKSTENSTDKKMEFVEGLTNSISDRNSDSCSSSGESSKRYFNFELPPEIDEEVNEYAILTAEIGCSLLKKNLAYYFQYSLNKRELNMFSNFLGFSENNLPSSTFISSFMKSYPDIYEDMPEPCEHFEEAKNYFNVSLKKYLFKNFGIVAEKFFSSENKNRIFCCSDFLLSSDYKCLQSSVQTKKRGDTVFFCCPASGKMLNPIVVNKGLTVKTYESSEYADNKYGQLASDNGLMNAEQFHMWLSTFDQFLVNEKIPKPVLLFFNSYAPYLSIPVFDYAKECGVIMFCFPSANRSLNPLDVSFPTLEREYKMIFQMRAKAQKKLYGFCPLALIAAMDRLNFKGCVQEVLEQVGPTNAYDSSGNSVYEKISDSFCNFSKIDAYEIGKQEGRLACLQEIMSLIAVNGNGESSKKSMMERLENLYLNQIEKCCEKLNSVHSYEESTEIEMLGDRLPKSNPHSTEILSAQNILL